MSRALMAEVAKHPYGGVDRQSIPEGPADD